MSPRTSDALALQVSQNIHQCLQIPDTSSLQLSGESSLNFLLWLTGNCSTSVLEVRVNIHCKTPCLLFLRRRHPLTQPSNSCCWSQLQMNVRPEPVYLACPRSLQFSSRRQGLVALWYSLTHWLHAFHE